MSFYELKKKLTDIFIGRYRAEDNQVNNNNVNNNVNANVNINNNRNHRGIQVLRRGGNNYGRLNANWEGRGMDRWNN